MARRRVDARRYDQCTQMQRIKISFQLVSRIGRIEHSASRIRGNRENRERQLRTVGEHNRDPILAAYSHGAQCAAHFADMPIKTGVAQRVAAGSKNRRGVGTKPGMVFKQIVEAQKRHGDFRLCANFVQHGLSPTPAPAVKV